METAEIGQRVSYEDMANPRRYGTVVETGIGWQGSEYRVEWLEGDETISDLRQHGWRPVEEETFHTIGVLREAVEAERIRRQGLRDAIAALEPFESYVGRGSRRMNMIATRARKAHEAISELLELVES